MEPGRELDMKIAEKMGVINFDRMGWITQYSTDRGAALRLLEELGITASLFPPIANAQYWTVHLRKTIKNRIVAEHKTLSGAIALACAKALGVTATTPDEGGE